MTKCDKCGSMAIAFQKYSGAHLCRDHFDHDLHRKVRESLREAHALGHCASVAVALDGSKGSAALLHSMKALFAHRMDLEFRAFFIDEGIEGYRDQSEARDLAAMQKVPFQVLSFKDAFGLTVDQVATQNVSSSTCAVCRAMKASLLHRAAREMGADLLATGECLDHEARAVMLNYLRGDMDGLQILRPGLKDRASPLRRVPEDEVALYCDIHGLPSRSGPCPYAREEIDLEVGRALDEFEAAHPGTKYSLLKGLDLLTYIKPDGGLPVCQRCGQPVVKGACQSCALLAEAASGAKPLSE
jgi:uncharacterized protein (TIGR00269 family)